MSPPMLTDLPNEILQQILFYVTPATVPNLQRISRRFNDLAQPLLWRYHCRVQFKYWNWEHQIKEKYLEDVVKVDWKSIFTKRHNNDRAVTHAIDSILSSQTGRIETFQRIVDLGYDVKDTLIRHMNIDDEAEDVLARRCGKLDSSGGDIVLTRWSQVLQRRCARMFTPNTGDKGMGKYERQKGCVARKSLGGVRYVCIA